MGELDRVTGWHVANEDRWVSPSEGVGRKSLDDPFDTLDAEDGEQVAECGRSVAEVYLRRYGFDVIATDLQLDDGVPDFLCRQRQVGTDVLVMVYTVVDAGADEDAPNSAMADERRAAYRAIALDYVMGFEGAVDMRLDVVAVNVLTERRTFQVHHFAGVCSWEG